MREGVCYCMHSNTIAVILSHVFVCVQYILDRCKQTSRNIHQVVDTTYYIIHRSIIIKELNKPCIGTTQSNIVITHITNKTSKVFFISIKANTGLKKYFILSTKITIYLFTTLFLFLVSNKSKNNYTKSKTKYQKKSIITIKNIFKYSIWKIIRLVFVFKAIKSKILSHFYKKVDFYYLTNALIISTKHIIYHLKALIFVFKSSIYHTTTLIYPSKKKSTQTKASISLFKASTLQINALIPLLKHLARSIKFFLEHLQSIACSIIHFIHSTIITKPFTEKIITLEL